jgi:hypothetical protein
VKTAAQAAQNWTGSQARATTAYNQGVQAFTGDWAGATTRQQSIMVQNWSQAVNSGIWASGVNRVGTNGWKSATEAKAGNYSTGFSAGANNFNAAIAKVINALQSGVSALPPRGDINANLQRANALALYMHGLKGQLGA